MVRTKLSRAKRKIAKKRSSLVGGKPKVIQGRNVTAVMTIDEDGRKIHLQFGEGGGLRRVLVGPGTVRFFAYQTDHLIECDYDEWLRIHVFPKHAPGWVKRHTRCGQVVSAESTGAPGYRATWWCSSCQRSVDKIYEGCPRPVLPRDPCGSHELRLQADFGRQFIVIAIEGATNWARCLGWNLFYPAAYHHGHVNKMGMYWEFMPILVDQFLEIASACSMKIDDRSISQMEVGEREFLDV